MILDAGPTISLGIYQIVSLVVASGLISVSATFLITLLQARWNQIEQRRKTAAVLGNEIASIKLLSNQAVRVHKVELGMFQDLLAKGTIMHMTLTDVDFSRAIYDRPSIDLTLFTPELAATIAELYRWTQFADHVKEGVNYTSIELSEALSRRKTAPAPILFVEADQEVKISVQNFINTLKGYINDHQRIADMSQHALDSLNKITKIDETKVKGDYFPTFESTNSSGSSK